MPNFMILIVGYSILLLGGYTFLGANGSRGKGAAALITPY